MHLKKFVLGLAIIGIAIPASATDRVMDLKTQFPNATPYEILNQVFEESHDIITFSDVKTHDPKCALANPEDKEPTSAVLVLAKVNSTLVPAIPAIPDQGPLFPGKPEVPAHVVSKFLLAAMTRSPLPGDLDGMYDVTTTTISQTEIVSVLAPSAKYVGLSYPAPYVTHVRKNGNLITFKIGHSVGLKDEKYNAGYCWN